jgi:hypothetical protein
MHKVKVKIFLLTNASFWGGIALYLEAKIFLSFLRMILGIKKAFHKGKGKDF